MTVTVFKPPHRPLSTDFKVKTIFLAGSIEMGKAQDWQTEITEYLEMCDVDVTIFNPRRDDWDSSWKQEASDPNFNGQVNWELNYLEAADIKAFYFDPETKSPVTLMELGLSISQYRSQCIVCSPPGFWRRGNIEIVCQRHSVVLLDNINDFKQQIVAKLLIP